MTEHPLHATVYTSGPCCLALNHAERIVVDEQVIAEQVGALAGLQPPDEPCGHIREDRS